MPSRTLWWTARPKSRVNVPGSLSLLVSDEKSAISVRAHNFRATTCDNGPGPGPRVALCSTLPHQWLRRSDRSGRLQYWRHG